MSTEIDELTETAKDKATEAKEKVIIAQKAAVSAVKEIEKIIDQSGADNILAIHSTISCFAPRKDILQNAIFCDFVFKSFLCFLRFPTFSKSFFLNSTFVFCIRTKRLI